MEITSNIEDGVLYQRLKPLLLFSCEMPFHGILFNLFWYSY